MEIAKCGMPRAKFAVPSMGSTTQTSRSKEPPPSSPKKESSGKSSPKRLRTISSTSESVAVRKS